MTNRQIEREELLTELRSILKPGDTITCVLRSVARSGMSRRIDFYKIQGDNEHVFLTSRFAKLGEGSYSREDWHNQAGMRVNGCGMDMGFSVVYNVGRHLFPKGFGVKGKGPHGHEIRPETPEKAAEAVRKGVSFHGRNGDQSGWDTDGGYALNYKWL